MLVPMIPAAVLVLSAQSAWPADSFRFAVIGDAGTGGRGQYEIAARMTELHTNQKFGSVLMLGDNLYGSQKPRDFRTKFELPYAKLLDAGVSFHAILGNHDEPVQQFYKPFNMEGRRFYTFEPHEGVRFFGLDSNRMDSEQLEWLERELARSDDAWKIAYFHHPVYSSGARHGSNLELRAILEPIFIKYGVTMALSGHDHFYERMKPQKGVHYFVVGGAAKLRSGNAKRTAITETAFDRDHSFLVMDIDRDTLRFRAISCKGETVDEGIIQRPTQTVSNQGVGAFAAPQ